MTRFQESQQGTGGHTSTRSLGEMTAIISNAFLIFVFNVITLLKTANYLLGFIIPMLHYQIKFINIYEEKNMVPIYEVCYEALNYLL